MDLYCQKCCKQLELDDSLSEIDQTLFLNPDISYIIKELDEIISKPSTSIAPKEKDRERETLILKQHQNQHHQQSSQGQLPQSLQDQIIQSPQQTSKMSKFKSGFFGKRKDQPTPTPTSPEPMLAQQQQQQQPPTQPTPIEEKKASQSFKTFYPSTHSNSISSNNSGVGIVDGQTSNNTTNTTTSSITGISPSSPSGAHSFGSLSQHRLSTSLKSNSIGNSMVTPPITTTSTTTTTTTNTSDKIISTSTSTSASTSPSPSIISPTISNNSRSTPRQRPMTSTPNKFNISSPSPSISQVSSPQKPKLKYLRSSSKSLSMASLPTISPDGTIIVDGGLESTSMNQHSVLQQSTLPLGASPIQTTPQFNPSNSSSNNNSNISSPTPTHTNSNTMMNSSTSGGSGTGENNYYKYMKGLSLFKITTELIHYDLPLCLECTKLTIAELEDEGSILDGEVSIYNAYLKQLEREVTNEQLEQLDKEMIDLCQEEQHLKQFIQDTYKERQQVEQLTGQLEEKRSTLKSLTDGYWNSFSELHYETFRNQDELQQASVQIQWVNDHLESLKQTNILNDAFHLWHDGHFATINSLRLGKLPSQPVEWNEINAAWGLSVSLLDAMAKKLKFTFSQYTLVPNGSCSRVDKKDVDPPLPFELYGTNDISLGKLFWYRRFDSGMIAFLQCIKELVDHIITRDPEFSVPYKIEKETIGGMCIKLQFTNDDTWTKSLKFMLTNLKWILIWVTKYDSQLLFNQQQLQQKQQLQLQQQSNNNNNNVNKRK